VLRQSWTSNYCGVYSTAMLLRAFGHGDFSRPRARRLFGIAERSRGRYPGSSLREVRAVLAKSLSPLRPRWQAYARVDGEAFRRSVARQLSASAATLVSFDAISSSCVRALHIVLLVGSNADAIECIDPLGRDRGDSANVVIDSSGYVHGAPYRVDVSRPTWLLLGLRSSGQRPR
jgi:hypothetical protein